MNTLSWRSPPQKTIRAFKVTIFLLSLLPFAGLCLDAAMDALGANPIEKITHTTGWWTLTFLMIVLTVTPLRKLSDWPWLMRFRRMLGLFAFFYGCLHFLTYLVLDQFFDWNTIVPDITKRPYITVGFLALVLMTVLAVTSNNAIIRHLGGKAWHRLHKLVYVIAVAGVVHFWWLVKKDISEPATFAVVLAILLGFRVVWTLREK
ncbi:Protein-methionine-sulfoxide reductase heme-binding subunit MsrQ [Gammaproteobacteria bacterium]